MADYLIQGDTLKDIADAIRFKNGETGGIKVSEMDEKIKSIPSSGTDTSDATAAAGDILNGKTAYISSGKATGTFTIDNELTTQNDLIAQIQTALEGKASTGETEPALQEKTVSPSTSNQTVKPDSGYDGLSQVIVNAMTTATQATPSITISSAGLITASSTQTEGYVGAGTKSVTKQLTTQAAKTITPSTSSQTAVASGRYTTGAITVGAIPSTYVKPTSTKSATTYTPTTSSQTIAAGTYCSGIQTIKGDANLKAENIAEGVSIFGVAGTHSGGGSGGGTTESCTVTFRCIDYLNDAPGYLYYIKPDLSVGIAEHQPDRNDPSKTTTITALKNSIACVMFEFLEALPNLFCQSTNGVETVENGLGPTNLFLIHDNGSIYVEHD